MISEYKKLNSNTQTNQNDAPQRKNRVYHNPDEDLRHDVWAQSDIQLVSPRFPQHSGTRALFGELFHVAGEADTHQPPPTESDIQQDGCPVFGDADGICPYLSVPKLIYHKQ